MSLSVLVESSKEIEIQSGKIVVNALNLKSFAKLFKFDTKLTEDIFTNKLDVNKLFVEWPDYCYKMISLSCELTVEQASKLPLGDQLNCILTILELSKIDGEVLGKLIIKVLDVIVNLEAQATDLINPELEQNQSQKS